MLTNVYRKIQLIEIKKHDVLCQVLVGLARPTRLLNRTLVSADLGPGLPLLRNKTVLLVGLELIRQSQVYN